MHILLLLPVDPGLSLAPLQYVNSHMEAIYNKKELMCSDCGNSKRNQKAWRKEKGRLCEESYSSGLSIKFVQKDAQN